MDELCHIKLPCGVVTMNIPISVEISLRFRLDILKFSISMYLILASASHWTLDQELIGLASLGTGFLARRVIIGV